MQKKPKYPIDWIYKEAPDHQKVWVETTDRFWRKDGLKGLKRSIEREVKDSSSLAISITSQLEKRPKLIADVGSGFGGLSINFALMRIKVVAIEPGELERRVFKYLLDKHPKAKKNLKIVEAFSEKIPIKSGSVDLCVLSQVLEHVKSPEKTIREIRRILKKGGYFHLSCPNYLFPYEQHYHLPFVFFLPRHLFSIWALLILKFLNCKRIREPQKRDFSYVYNFINSVNYTNHFSIKTLLNKNHLTIINSSIDEERNFKKKLAKHWSKNPKPFQFFLILVSVPKKLITCLIAKLAIYPLNLKYLARKN